MLLCFIPERNLEEMLKRERGIRKKSKEVVTVNHPARLETNGP